MANPHGIGPQTEFGDQLHGMKYRGKGEDFREAMNRVSFGLKDSDKHYHQLRDILLPMRFMPGGRIQSAIGALRQVTPYNCFVSGTIADSFVDGDGSIMQRAHEAAATMRMGGGIGYDFSTLRPRNALIRRLQSHSSGPVSFMRIFNEVCLCTSSSGHRRGAQMCVFRIDHPDIEEYIRAKQNTTDLVGFNLSVGVTNEFMECVATGKPFDLRWGGEVHRTIDAQALWDMLMRSTWDWGEPGVIFIDRINELNNLWYCEQIGATNPCAEQPLPPFGACLLGSFNLVKYLIPAPGIREASPMGNANWALDYDLLREDIPIVVRAMDNVVDRAIYPLAQQKAEAITKRRMGLGITGLANALEATGRAYGSPEFLEAEDEVLALIERDCYIASAHLAAEKGAFPIYDEDKYLRGQHIQSLDGDVQDLIRRYGIRNSHLTSIAPTGTISMCADYVSSALEPVFKYEMDRPVNTPDGQMIAKVRDYGVSVLGVHGRLAHDITADEHVNVQVVAQRHSDSAVSKTVNMDGTKMSWDDFKGIYTDVWERGGKSCSTFNATGERAGLIRASTDEEGQACTVDPETGHRDCA